MSNKRNMILLVLLFIPIMIGWNMLLKHWGLIPTPPPPKPTQESVTLVMGGMASGVEEVANLKRKGVIEQPEEPKKEPEAPPKAKEPPKLEAGQAPETGELIAMGNGDYYVQVMANSRGGSIQQVILTQFKEADRGGREVINPDGVPRLLHLVPGVRVPRAATINEQRRIDQMIPALKEGPYEGMQAAIMNEPSFLIFHYDKPGDERPLLTLGNKRWDFLKDQSDLNPAAEEQRIVFQTELGEPHNVRITKTFTLKRHDYHVGLKVDIKRLDGKSGPNQFRYQLTGAHALPIEGEWYTSTFRNAEVGFSDDSREIHDAASIRRTEGTDRIVRAAGRNISYAAVATQFFASAIAVDDQQEKRDFLEFVRATPADAHPPLKPGSPGRKPEFFDFLDDITVRAISEPVNPDTNPSHKYLLYHGPVKVRLLGLMPSQSAVHDPLVERYLDNLHLRTLTDAPLPNVLGRFANSIYWTDMVIWFTNRIHSLLWALNQVIPALGICILVVTVMVRGMLFPFSRKQSANGQIMQAKMAKLQPEIKKLKEKFGGDPQKLHVEQMKLYKEHGVNPFAAMGGCMLLLLQMPVFMGLYYALQESIFFRLDRFLWIPNLAAPDMLVYWTESIPFISQPSDLGSTLYLGPYFNLLPFLAVGLMLVQQIKMMPKSDDPQVQAQQRMMKFMMIIFGVFFYKMPAGLCLYFIASTLWGLTERKFLPKPKIPGETPQNEWAPVNDAPPKEPKQLGWFGRKKREWKIRWDAVLEQAQKQQEFRRDPSAQPPDKGGKKKKRKK